MPNPSGTDHDDEPAQPDDNTSIADRPYTAPGFDANSTNIIDSLSDPQTELICPSTEVLSSSPKQPQHPVRSAPQFIAPRTPTPAASTTRRHSWGLVVMVIVVFVALAAVVIAGTISLSRNDAVQISAPEQVRSVIENFDNAVQRGDLAMLRAITCGQTHDTYAQYDERTWAAIHAKVSAAQQYPVVASIDDIVIHDDGGNQRKHAEVNVTSFMAFDPATRSTRSFDLQFHDNEWKICHTASAA